jgi:hypothetical protein
MLIIERCPPDLVPPARPTADSAFSTEASETPPIAIPPMVPKLRSLLVSSMTEG